MLKSRGRRVRDGRLLLFRLIRLENREVCGFLKPLGVEFDSSCTRVRTPELVNLPVPSEVELGPNSNEMSALIPPVLGEFCG